jgi:cytochrome d ubiquinol oxidase subunit I
LQLFAIPDETTQTNGFSISVPKLASLILTHDANGELQGLDAFPGQHPPVATVFWTFRIMVGVGVLMLLFAWLASAYLLARRNLPKWLLTGLAAMTFSGWIAVLAGWLTTEIGRQPYIVYGLITTAETASSVPAPHIALTLVAYAAVYALLLVSYMVVVTQLAGKDTGGTGALAADAPAGGIA